MRMRNSYRSWTIALALSLPVIIFFLAYFCNHSPKAIPTGFIQYDNVSYAGNARALAAGSPALFYANRLNESDAYPRIYFQPQHLLLAALMRAGLAPGPALCLFTILFAWVFFRVAISLFDALYPEARCRGMGLVLFSWGGGLLALGGWLLFWCHVSSAPGLAPAGLSLDPAAGWWGLNLGRSLFFSMESYYHVLFFAGMYFLVTRRWVAATAAAGLLSLSHPFSGLEFLAIGCAWLLVEKAVYKNKAVPAWLLPAVAAIGLFHLWLYLIHLNRFPEHAAVFTQYRLNWKLRFYNIIPAYLAVALAAAWAVKQQSPLRHFLSRPQTRLLVCWATVAFLLANHDWFVNGIQPLHFTRGYIWAPLFLLGWPACAHALSLWGRSWRMKALLTAGVCFFLLDNINWLVLNCRYTASAGGSVSYISPEERDVLYYLRQHTGANSLLIGHDPVIPYLATVYTPAYAWISHAYNTPFYARKLAQYRAFLETGDCPAAWTGRDLVFIAHKNDGPEMARFMASGAKKEYETQAHIVYRCRPCRAH